MNPELLIGNKITLEAAAKALTAMNEFQGLGLTLINQF
jgi:hypothetical protein